MKNELPDDWKVGDKFTTPETNDTIFTVYEITGKDVVARDARSMAGYTNFAKWWITKVTPTPLDAGVQELSETCICAIDFVLNTGCTQPKGSCKQCSQQPILVEGSEDKQPKIDWIAEKEKFYQLEEKLSAMIIETDNEQLTNTFLEWMGSRNKLNENCITLLQQEVEKSKTNQ